MLFDVGFDKILFIRKQIPIHRASDGEDIFACIQRIDASPLGRFTQLKRALAVAVQLGRLLDLHGYILEVAADNPDDQRHSDQLVDPDQAEVGIVQADLLEDQEYRQDDQDLRRELEGKNLEGNIFLILEIVACKAVSCGNAGNHGDQHSAASDDQVLEEGLEVVRADQNFLIVVQRGGKVEHRVVHLRVGLECTGNHPDDGKQRKDCEADQRKVAADEADTLEGFALCSGALRLPDVRRLTHALSSFLLFTACGLHGELALALDDELRRYIYNK